MVRLSPACKENNVPIACSSNEYFLPYTAVMLRSILAHALPEKHYDILLLHSELSQDACSGLLRLTEAFPNCTLRFYDVSALCGQISFFTEGGNGMLTRESYYRLLLGDILSEAYDRVLYLDGDMVACADVSDLLDVELDGYYLAAVPDPGGIGLVRSRTDAALRAYWEQVLQMKDLEAYFNAGVLVLNLRTLRRDYPAERLLHIATERSWQYHDQDVLNYVCREGGAKLLESAWNVLTDCGAHRHSPTGIWESYLRAARTPRIVHYAGKRKPWIGPVWRETFFWQEAAESGYFETIVRRMTAQQQMVSAQPHSPEEIDSVCREIQNGTVHPSWAGILERLEGQKLLRDMRQKYRTEAATLVPGIACPETDLRALQDQLPLLQEQVREMIGEWPWFEQVLCAGCMDIACGAVRAYGALPRKKRKKYRMLVREMRNVIGLYGRQLAAENGLGRLGYWKILLCRYQTAPARFLTTLIDRVVQMKNGRKIRYG